MDIKVTFDPSVAAAPASFKAVVLDVAKFYDTQFANPITINIDVGWGEVEGQALSTSALGESISNYVDSDLTYAQIKAALVANAHTTQAKTSVASLGATDPTGGGAFTMTTAEAKALGLLGASGAVDGYAGFDSTPGAFDYSVTSNNALNNVTASEYDFFGVVAHEFSEVLGRQMNFGISFGGGAGDGSGYDPLDLFDYSATGVRSFDPNGAYRYFSINGGAFSFGQFNTDALGDLFDWDASAGTDSFDAFSTKGTRNVVTANDLTLMNVIGYQPTPEFSAAPPSLDGETLTFTIDNVSQGKAPASVAGIYISPTFPITTADTLLTTAATPAIAGGGAVSVSVALSLSHLAPGFYYVSEIANADGAVVESSTSFNAPTSPVGIAILDNANIATASQDVSYSDFAFQALDLKRNFAFGGLYVAAAISGPGALEIGGGTFAAGTSLTNAEVSIINGGNYKPVVIATNLTYAGFWNDIFNSAPLQINQGDTLTLTGAANLLEGAVSGPGAIRIAGGATSFRNAALDKGPTVATLGISGAATMVSVSGNLNYAGFWDQTAGTTTVASGFIAKLSGAGDVFTGALTGAGAFFITGSGDSFRNVTLGAASTRIVAPVVDLAGTIDITGVVSLTSAVVNVAAGVTRLTGGGTLQLADVATNQILGGASSTLLENVSDRILGAGELGGGALRLDNEAGGIIDGNRDQALTIDTPAGVVVNAGLIEAVGTGGVTIAGAVSNSGTLSALGGDLTVTGAVSGAGGVKISGGVARFESTFSQNVVFTSTGGTLDLANSAAYRGTISGFSKTGAASLDLGDIDFALATESFSGTTASGVLTVTDGTHTAHIKLAGNYQASTWTLASDGAGGTRVTDPTPASPAALASALAGFAPAPAAAAESHAPPTPTFPLLAHAGPPQ